MTIENVKSEIIAGKSKTIEATTQAAIDNGEKPADILAAMIKGMDIVGEKFSAGEIFVPEMLVAAKTMKKGLEIIKPLLAGADVENYGKCIIGTVKGDLHDIGKNLVSTMIGTSGFDVIDLGVDVPIETFINTIKENPDVKVVALSALLTTTMDSMKETVKALKEIQADYGFKILVGGAPITQAFADEIGADAYSLDAGAAAVKAKELVQ